MKKMTIKKWLVSIVILACFFARVNGMEKKENQTRVQISEDLNALLLPYWNKYDIKTNNPQIDHTRTIPISTDKEQDISFIPNEYRDTKDQLSEKLIDYAKRLPAVWKVIFAFMGVKETFSHLALVHRKIYNMIDSTLIQMNPLRIFQSCFSDTLKKYFMNVYADNISVLDDATLSAFGTNLDMLEVNEQNSPQRAFWIQPDYLNDIILFSDAKIFTYYNVQDLSLYHYETKNDPKILQCFPMFFHFKFLTDFYNCDLWYRIDDLAYFKMFLPTHFKFQFILGFRKRDEFGYFLEFAEYFEFRKHKNGKYSVRVIQFSNPQPIEFTKVQTDFEKTLGMVEVTIGINDEN